jgi:hypothetical protein
MGRALSIARTRDLPWLFRFFGLEAQPEVVDAHSSTIAARFQAELGAIERCCGGLREKERYRVIRAALQLSYESAAVRGLGEAG